MTIKNKYLQPQNFEEKIHRNFEVFFIGGIQVKSLRAVASAHKETKFTVSLEGWQVTDCYMFEIHSVDPNYPQSRKVIYMNQEFPVSHYGYAWDRAGVLWKCWWGEETKDMELAGQKYNSNWSQFGIDIQLGYAGIFHFNIDPKYKNQKNQNGCFGGLVFCEN